MNPGYIIEHQLFFNNFTEKTTLILINGGVLSKEKYESDNKKYYFRIHDSTSTYSINNNINFSLTIEVDGTEKTVEVEKFDTAQKGRISVSKRGDIFKSAGVGGMIKAAILWCSLSVAGGLAWNGITSQPETAALLPAFPWFSLLGNGLQNALVSVFSLLVGMICTQSYIQAIFSASNPRTASVGAFTAALIKGMGCRYTSGKYLGSMPADQNNDKKVTLKELYDYIDQQVRSWKLSQSAQYYGPDDFVLFKR